jgi:hypothetical protein
VTVANYTGKRKKDLTRRTAWRLRKEKEMRNAQIIPQRDEAEEELVVWLKAKSIKELDQFLAGSWTASILSSEAIEELHKYQ